jgi:hypothetical protein
LWLLLLLAGILLGLEVVGDVIKGSKASCMFWHQLQSSKGKNDTYKKFVAHPFEGATS